ncbi:restriction system protein [Streptomyces sp. Amel2xB2]|nr:restriction system protein [Streptomyces sp. Amel2xB2]
MGAVLFAGTVVYWSTVWPYVVAAVLAGLVGVVGWRLWRTDHLLKSKDQVWRREDEVRSGHRTLNEVDRMSGTEFEEHVAELCRRDGCGEVQRVGGAGDDGADVRGRLPDGRSMVVQCKRYAASRPIPPRDLRELAGSRVHFAADVAVFVTTSRFTDKATAYALANSIVTVHRDVLGLWNKGTPLTGLFEINGSGQGDRAHRVRWRNTYGSRPQGRGRGRDRGRGGTSTPGGG